MTKHVAVAKGSNGKDIRSNAYDNPFEAENDLKRKWSRENITSKRKL